MPLLFLLVILWAMVLDPASRGLGSTLVTPRSRHVAGGRRRFWCRDGCTSHELVTVCDNMRKTLPSSKERP